MSGISSTSDFVAFGLAVLGLAMVVLLWLSAWRCKHEQPKCEHRVTSRPRWTQDGWVTVCLACREWIYHGDDYERDRPA